MVNNKKKNKKKLNPSKLKKNNIIIETIEHTINDNGGISLKFPFIDDADLPHISIITPTRNKGDIFKLAVHHFLNFDYPREKLEWVILDNGSERIKKYLDFKDESNLIYMTLDGSKRYNIGDLRNTCIEKTSYSIIINMDDDDFYPPESLKSRVKSLLKYYHRGIECVGCVNGLTYNIHSKTSETTTNGQANFMEASMCYTKKFWQKRKYDPNCSSAEYSYFLKDRHKQMMNIPCQFVLIVINHNKNYTERGNRRDKIINKSDNREIAKAGDNIITTKENTYFEQLFGPEIMKIINSINANSYPNDN